MEKVFGILFTDEGLRELEPALKPYLSEGSIGKYLYCKKVDPNGNYFHIVAECSNLDGTKFEADISVPHRFIKIVISATDKKQIGFI